MTNISFNINDYHDIYVRNPTKFYTDPSEVPARNSSQRMTIVFDIDETLLHLSEKGGGNMTINLRDGVLELIDNLLNFRPDVEVILWSLGILPYAACVGHVLEQIVILLGDGVFGSGFSYIIGNEPQYHKILHYNNVRRTKPLDLLRRNNIVIIDNSPIAAICNGNKSLLISDFFGCPNDRKIHELKILLDKSIEIAQDRFKSDPEDPDAFRLLSEEEQIVSAHVIETQYGLYPCAVLPSYSESEKEKAACCIDIYIPALIEAARIPYSASCEAVAKAVTAAVKAAADLPRPIRLDYFVKKRDRRSCEG